MAEPIRPSDPTPERGPADDDVVLPPPAVPPRAEPGSGGEPWRPTPPRSRFDQDEPVVESRDEPVTRDAPVVRDEPVARDAPAVRDEPVARDEPATREAPVAREEPGARQEPVTRDEPVAVAPETRPPVEPARAETAPFAPAPVPPGPVASAPVAPVPPAPTQQQPLAPVAADAPRPPKRRGNRLAATAWVFLAAGLFELLYFVAVAAVQAALSGPNAVVPFVTAMVQAQSGVFAWLPVLFFFLLFELTVLIAGRAGRFFYVVASGVVAILVFVLSVVLISIVLRGAVPDSNLLAQTFQSPLFILIGIVAREVMLWTGFAIGARGKRLRDRDRADRDRYDRERAERSGSAA